MTIQRIWAMPSRHTFTIKPIADRLAALISDPMQWFDPFCGLHSPAGRRNDLNPAIPDVDHLDAQAWLETHDRIDNLLFDPPYSPRQISECYKAIGLKVGVVETQNATLYARVKEAARLRMPIGSLAVCCGWNSMGMGQSRGFELEEILLVPHGGAHNDTIMTIERKVR